MPEPGREHYLHLSDIELWVHLGAGASERVLAQPVCLNLMVRFAHAPKATQTDRLEDTVCYATLVTQLRAHVGSKSFCLIEHLHYFISLWLIAQGYTFDLAVTKMRPPLEGIGSVTFGTRKT